MGYTVGANQGGLQLLGGRSQSNRVGIVLCRLRLSKRQSGYVRLVLEGDELSASECNWLIAKRFNAQIIRQFFRMTVPWVTIKAKRGLQHRLECAMVYEC